MMQENTEKKKKKRGCLKAFLIMVGVLFSIFVVIVVLALTQEKRTEKKYDLGDLEVLVDTTQFYRLTPEALIDIMGEPDSIDDWNYKVYDTVVHSVITYCYLTDIAYYEFDFCDEQIRRMHIYSLNYWTGEGEDIYFEEENKIFGLLGIEEPLFTMEKETDTGLVLAYSIVSTEVEYLKIQMIDSSESTFQIARIQYDSDYFGE